MDTKILVVIVSIIAFGGTIFAIMLDRGFGTKKRDIEEEDIWNEKDK